MNRSATTSGTKDCTTGDKPCRFLRAKTVLNAYRMDATNTAS